VLAIDRVPIQEGRGDRCLQSDLGDPILAEAIVDGGFDAAFLLAGSGSVGQSLADPELDLADNAGKLLRFLESVRPKLRGTRLVYVSSAAVYGEVQQLPVTESAPLRPISPYGVSKLAGESYARVYHHLYALETLIARPFSVYGPGARKQVVWDLLVKLHSRDVAQLQGTGQETRDFVYVDDACAALVEIALAGVPGHAYNVCSGRETSIAELAACLSRLAGKPPAVFGRALRMGDPSRWCGDPSRLREIGWEAKVDLESGLGQTLAWYLSLDAR
jgi:nucleoside-diphosphate-sugar epimerase